MFESVSNFYPLPQPCELRNDIERTKAFQTFDVILRNEVTKNLCGKAAICDLRSQQSVKKAANRQNEEKHTDNYASLRGGEADVAIRFPKQGKCLLRKTF